MGRADSRNVSCGVTVCSPAGAPGAPAAFGAERLAAERRAPARRAAVLRAGALPRAAVLRAGALRRAGFFGVFFFAMESSANGLPETTVGARRQRNSTIYRLQLARAPESP